MKITVDEIVDLVARYYFITHEEITGPRNKHVFSHPRQMAMYLARTYTDASSTRIGLRLGGRDHTTVLTSARLLPERVKGDEAEYKDLMHFRSVLDERKKYCGYEAAYDLAWSTWAFIHRRTPMDQVTVVDGIYREQRQAAE